MKKLVFLIFVIFLNSGCVSYQELNNVGIIDTLGIDYVNNNYVLMTNILEINNNQKLEIKTYTNSDNNLINALNNLYLIVNKNINYNNLSLLILSSNLNNDNLNTIIHNLKSIKDFRNDFNTVYIDSNELSSLFNLRTKASDLNNQIEISAKELGVGGFITFENVLKDYLSDNNILISYLTLLNDQITIKGYKIMNNNFLDREESILYNYLIDKIEKTTLKKDCLFLNINESKTKINSDHNTINISINSKITLIENHCSSQLSNKDILEKYNQYLKTDLTSLFNKYRSIDLFNFSNLIMKNDYWYYKNNYNNLLNHLNLQIKINSKFEKEGANEKT